MENSDAAHPDGPIELAGVPLTGNRHVCAFFNSLDEEYEVLMDFIADGFGRGDREVHIINSLRYIDHIRRLETAGVEAEAAIERGQLEVLGWKDVHLPDGRFDPDAMLNLFEKLLSEGKAQGYSLTRLLGQVEWITRTLPGVDAYIEFEARLNCLLPQYEDVVICAYDVSKFSGAVLLDVLRTHPIVIIGRVLQQNLFYIPPDQFLAELRERRSKSIA